EHHQAEHGGQRTDVPTSDAAEVGAGQATYGLVLCGRLRERGGGGRARDGHHASWGLVGAAAAGAGTSDVLTPFAGRPRSPERPAVISSTTWLLVTSARCTWAAICPR